MIFLAITLVTFFAMEGIAYLAHRFLFHGVLWFLHKSHHEPRSAVASRSNQERGRDPASPLANQPKAPRKTRLEWNDLFGVFFAPIAVVLMSGWIEPAWRPYAYPVGLGMTLYGVVYFFIHDMYTHRRFWNIDIPLRWFGEMRSAHRYHHANIQKKGQEPYGFLFFQTYKPALRNKPQGPRRA